MLKRWGKFNLVGAIGMVVQLAFAAIFNRWFGRHYLIASVAAVEIAVIHNFIWHCRYTWTERLGSTTILRAFVRFQVSNGLISLAGNAIATKLLVERGNVPALYANVVAIAVCALANFWAADCLAFQSSGTHRSRADRALRSTLPSRGKNPRCPPIRFGISGIPDRSTSADCAPLPSRWRTSRAQCPSPPNR